MDRQQARQAITDLFDHPFDRERYQHFINNLLNQYEPRNGHYTGNYIPDAFKQHVKQYWRIGKYRDPDGEELDLLVVQVKTLSKLERARSALRNFAVTRLKQFEKEASLIAFYAEDDKGADWRFSFVKIEHEAYRDDKGKIKLKQELTPAKRYSYLVGVHENSHTASKQLLPLLEMDYADPRIEEIETAFSIEKVTGEFFEQYKALFKNLAEHLKSQPLFNKSDEAEQDQQVSRFAKKLLGQIVFLYFLQKKGWLGVEKDKPWGTGSKRFMRERFDQIGKEGGDYYHDFLQYLFYEALADERKGQDDPGYYTYFDCRVPFLNGGLFEPDYDWRKETMDLPDTLFHNDEKNKSGDVGTGILDVFGRYNFTIKEDEPLEKEVAVDPEMLGKVFENMLEVTERKSKGAFYTPREIVHYMCQESLIHYLDNRLNSYASTPELSEPQTDIFGSPSGQQSLGDGETIKAPKVDLEVLIRKGHLALENDQRVLSKGKETDTYKFQLPESVRSRAKDIDVALADIKVCDPAIGSGAFPVGLLHEIVNTRLALAPHSGNHHSTYELKRHAIAESLYGVDIDASAIDIARLRLWLSLIVDEEDYDTIEALPNLDYKIVCGNSLIGFPENWSSPAFIKIEEMKKKFFEETDHEKKVGLKVQIDNEIQKRLDGSMRTFGWHVDFDFRLFFSEVWHEKNGFDLVIGNPPYIRQELLGSQKKNIQRTCPKTFSGTSDLYVFFYERAHQLIHEAGIVSLITSDKWYKAAYGKKLRNFIQKENSIISITCFGHTKIFEVSAYPTIVFLIKKVANPKHTFSMLDWLCVDPTSNLSEIVQLAKSQSIEVVQEKLGERGWHFLDLSGQVALDRILRVPSKLQDYLVTKVRRGVTTGLNDAFVISGEIKDKIVRKEPHAKVLIKPFARGKNLQKWVCKPSSEFIIFTRRGLDISNFPEIEKYLKFYKERLTPGAEGGRKKGAYKWFEIQDNTAYWQEFEKEKIVSTKISRKPTYSLDKRKCFLANTAYFFSVKENTNFFLGVLNSSISHFYSLLVFVGKENGYYEVQPENLERFPIPTNNADIVKFIGILTSYVVSLYSLNFDVASKLTITYLEIVVDGLAFELYFPDEIKAANKEILPHLGDLPPITGDMAEEEKLAIIHHEFDRLYDPHHPVRNNLETLDSVEVVRTIREALKK